MTNRVIYQPEPPFIVEVGEVVEEVGWADDIPTISETLTGWEFYSAHFTEQDARGRADKLAEDTFYVRVVRRV